MRDQFTSRSDLLRRTMARQEAEVQEAIDLTAKQKAAVAAFKRAIAACKRENVYFYSVLDTVNFLNGNNVEYVENEDYFCHDENPLGCSCDLNMTLEYDGVTNCGFDSWADDTHYVVLTDRYLKKLEAGDEAGD